LLGVSYFRSSLTTALLFYPGLQTYSSLLQHARRQLEAQIVGGLLDVTKLSLILQQRVIVVASGFELCFKCNKVALSELAD